LEKSRDLSIEIGGEGDGDQDEGRNKLRWRKEKGRNDMKSKKGHLTRRP
jgi:hypothetical protein